MMGHMIQKPEGADRTDYRIRIMGGRWLGSIVALVVLAVAMPGALMAVDFQSEVRVILSDKCFKCHGPAKEGRKAGLRLDTENGSRAAADNGLKVIEPGNPEKSELIARIFTSDPDDIMPPPESKMELTTEEKAILREWVNEGARYDAHWSFRTIQKPPVPDISSLKTGEYSIQNPIDAFVLARMQARNLSFESSADRNTLLRRLTFDLTGLPPTLDELESFAGDASEDAYEKKVDELMRRRSFGERLTSEWLDVARYSDTYGYQVDRDRHVWPWRDWVIDAFNTNLPYDRFIQWQIAGDMLPDATRDQILATTFNRLHPQKVEGGSVPEEFRVEYVSDRLHTIGTAFLGLTLECARCHDHKYDPITQEEYYQLTSFFDNIDEFGLYSYFTSSVPTPTLLLSNEDQDRKINELNAEIQSLESSIGKTLSADSTIEETRSWLSTLESPIRIPEPAATFDFDAMDGGKIVNGSDNEKPASTGGGNKIVDADGAHGKAIKLTGDDAVNLPLGNFSRSQPFSIQTRILIPEKFERSVVFHRSRAWTDAGSRGYEFLILDGHGQFSLIHFWPGNAASIRTVDELPVGQWLDLTVTSDGSGSAQGLTIYLNGDPAQTEILYDNLYKNITGGGGDNITIGERFRDRGFKNGLVDHMAIYDLCLTHGEILTRLQGKQDISRSDMESWEPSRISAFRLHRDNSEFSEKMARLIEKRTERNKILDSINEIMVMRESQKPHQTYLLDRGHYESRGHKVESGTPATLHPISSQSGHPDRLDFAQWLISRKNPLTARVTVNRYWQMIFGRGLVQTSEDFGLQGSPPTHPELLDWLAAEFMDQGWDLRWLIRTMVTSHTYRQSSITSVEKRKLDPQNRFLSWAPSYRLAAEMIRDNALLSSGLLVDKVGGAPVRPYEVEQSFKFANRQKGEALYRRSLYTWWKRTGPAPTMLALDASKRDVCTVRRERTSTPIQAFIFLNDPQFVEAARVTVLNNWDGNSENSPSALQTIFRLLTSRKPTPTESEILGKMYRDQLSFFQSGSDSAEEFLAVGDWKAEPDQNSNRDINSLAAMTAVTSAIFAHDECIMKR